MRAELNIDPVEPDNGLPRRVDAVVIGGGIVGASTALFLSKAGLSVALCEKGRIAGEQSSRNWGWCRKMGRDPSEIPLAIESLRLWENMNELTGAETGFRKAGILYVCEDDRALAEYEEWREHARLYQLDSRLVGASEIASIVPGSARQWAGGLYTPSDGRAEPERAAPAIANAVRKAGGHVLTGCAVRGVETRAGRIGTVVTERGPIECQAAVLAGGAWSRLFCGNLGIDFPQLKIMSSVLRTRPLSGPPEIAVGASNFAFRKRLDGGYTIAQRNANIAPIVPDSFRLLRDFAPALRTQWGEVRLRIGKRFLEEWRLKRRWGLDERTPFEEVRILDPEPSPRMLEKGIGNLVRAFPAFKDMVVAGRWAGLIDVTPDAVPVISDVPAMPGFFIASGFSGHGFGIGPGAGRLMADLVTGSNPVVDPAPFALDRFARGRNGGVRARGVSDGETARRERAQKLNA